MPKAKKWHEDGLAVKRIAVNVSGQQFALPNFVEVVSGSWGYRPRTWHAEIEIPSRGDDG